MKKGVLPYVHELGLFLLMLLATQAFGQGMKWSEVEVDGVKYVSVFQLSRFYRFEELEVNGAQALATGIHWVTLKELGRSDVSKVEAGRIALGQEDRLKKLNFPACRFELTMDSLAKMVNEVKLMELSQSMAESLVQGLLLARKAARQNQTKAVKDATTQ